MLREIFEKKDVILESLSSFKKILPSGTNLIKLGNNVKVIINEVIKPKVIIHPKSITGLISLNIRDRNAIIVVSTVYKIGQNILLVVNVINRITFFSGLIFFN